MADQRHEGHRVRCRAALGSRCDDRALARLAGQERPRPPFMTAFTAASGPPRLQEFVAAGYLLHGSPRSDLTLLEPRAFSHDRWVVCEGPVVFATADPVVAVLFALLDRRRWCGQLDIERVPGRGAPTTYRISVEASDDPIGEAGTVWVVPRD